MTNIKKKERRCRCGTPLKSDEAYECLDCYVKTANDPPKNPIGWDNPYAEDE